VPGEATTIRPRSVPPAYSNLQIPTPQNVEHLKLLSQLDGVVKREDSRFQTQAHSLRGRRGYGREQHRIDCQVVFICISKGQYNTLFSVQNARCCGNL
jgi:hypothetical protein